MAQRWHVECPWVDRERLVTSKAIGGPGGDKFELIGKEGTFLKSLVFFMKQDRVMGLTATLSDGRSETVGRTAGPASVLNFSFVAGEEFSHVVMKGARVPQYDTVLFGGMVITTAEGRRIEAMAEMNVRLGEEVEYPVGSGTCVGVFGWCGWEIDCFGLAMAEGHLAG